MAGLALTVGAGARSAWAAPVPGTIAPIAVYEETPHSFGVTYDSKNDKIWFSEGDTGDSLIHSLKPFKDFTAADLAGLPKDAEGIPIISQSLGQLDVAGTTNPAGGAHFDALAFDNASEQMVAHPESGSTLESFDPFTAANLNSNYRPDAVPGISGLVDGLDVKNGNVWYSPDAADIFLNGSLFASQSNPAQKVKMSDGAIMDQEFGWSGVTQAGDNLFAVAVLNPNDVGRSRTLVKFDLSGNLVGFDPNGDPIAARWEGLAFDGTYLYAADLRGNATDAAQAGNIYVFQGTGGLVVPPPTGVVPEPGSLALLLTGGLPLLGLLRRRVGL